MVTISCPTCRRNVEMNQDGAKFTVPVHKDQRDILPSEDADECPAVGKVLSLVRDDRLRQLGEALDREALDPHYLRDAFGRLAK